MKILIYAHLFPPSLGGMQFQNLEIAQGLNSLGHEVEVLACENKGVRAFVKKLNFPVHLLPKWPFAPMHSLGGISLTNWAFIPFYLLKLKKLLSRRPPEVVLIADETANFFWGFFVRCCKIPYVSYCSVPLLSLLKRRRSSTLRNILSQFWPDIIRKLLRMSYENSHIMLVVSNSTKEELVREIPKLVFKTHIIPNSIDKRFFNMEYQSERVKQLKDKFGIPLNCFVLLSVTRLTLDKGVDDVIRALSSLSLAELQKLRYVIVGEGEAEKYLRQLTSKLGLNKTVNFTGGVPHFELIPYYDMCDLFVLPPRRGRYESFGRVFVEAAARSKPSIGAKEGGMLDVIDDGFTGFLVPPGDIKAIRNKLISLMDDRETLFYMGKKAKIKAEQNYTSQIVATQFAGHLKRVLEQEQGLAQSV